MGCDRPAAIRRARRPLTLAAPRGTSPPATYWLLVYGSLILIAETVLALVDVALGAMLHALILIAVASHAAYSRVPGGADLPVIGLVPLIRLLSIVLLIPGIDPIYWLGLVGAPALAGAALAMRAMSASFADIGLARPRSWWEQASMASVGLPLGWLAVNVVRLPGMPAEGVHPAVFLAMVVPFVVLLEELVYRGLIQRAASVHGAMVAVLAPNIFYAATYFSTTLAGAILFMGATGVLFSFIRYRTGSLWGVIGANLLLRIGLQI